MAHAVCHLCKSQFNRLYFYLPTTSVNKLFTNFNDYFNWGSGVAQLAERSLPVRIQSLANFNKPVGCFNSDGTNIAGILSLCQKKGFIYFVFERIYNLLWPILRILGTF